MEIVIKKPKPEDAEELTKVAIASKKHWGYPDRWLDLWKDELTMIKGRVLPILEYEIKPSNAQLTDVDSAALHPHQ